jgi:hypothetical protein
MPESVEMPAPVSTSQRRSPSTSWIAGAIGRVVGARVIGPVLGCNAVSTTLVAGVPGVQRR